MATVRKRKWTHNGVEKEAWVVSYTDHSGTRRLKTFDKKKDADKYRIQVENEIGNGEHVAVSESATVREICEMFMKHCDARLKDKLIGRNTYALYDQAIRLHIVPRVGSKILSTLTLVDVEHWYSDLEKASRRSKAHYLNVFRLVETFAIKRGYAKRKPVREYRVERGSYDHEPIKTFDVDQMGAILRTCETREKAYTEFQHQTVRCAVNLAAICGLRRGEIFGLTLEHIDFENGVIRVRHSMTPFGVLKGPKTKAGIRDVPMPQHVAAMLLHWLNEHYIPNELELVFTSREGKPAHFTSSLHSSWRRILHRAGVQDVDNVGYHFHALRHFAASWSLEMGMSAPDVAALLGHRTFDMTLQVYAHPVQRGDHRKRLMQSNTNALFDATRVQHEGVTV